MICRHKLYHFTVANLVVPRRVSGAVKWVFTIVISGRVSIASQNRDGDASIYHNICSRHTVPILTHDGHTNIYLILREVTPEDGNKIIFIRRRHNCCGRLHDDSRTIHGGNTKDTRN